MSQCRSLKNSPKHLHGQVAEPRHPAARHKNGGQKPPDHQRTEKSGRAKEEVFEACLGFGVWGLGFGVWGLGFRV